MKKFLIYTFAVLLALSCSKSPVNNNPADSGKVNAPSDVEVEQVSNTKVIIRWKDNSKNETGFDIFIKSSDNLEKVDLVKTVKSNTNSFAHNTGLELGKGYYIGIQANAADEQNDSKIEWAQFTMQDLANLPSADIYKTEEWPACLAVEYALNQTGSGAKYGLCWSMEKTPTINDNFQYGPIEKDSNTNRYYQVIPNIGLEYGKPCHVRAFVKTRSGVYYSQEKLLKLKDNKSAIKLDWKKVGANVPSAINVFETTSPVGGRVFHGWYAIADMKKDVELRVLDAHDYKTVDQQFNEAGDCYVLVNGGFFYNKTHIGITVRDFKLEGSIWGSRGSLDSKNDPVEYNKEYWMTRGTFGVDGKGKPSVCWAATGNDGKIHYFDKPMPTVVGECKYARASADYPCPEITWKPKNAISGGPVLVYEGNCCFDFSTTPRSKYNFICNYEVMAYDIFGTRSGTPDRTAIGCTKDGKIILFACDGRIPSSKGATLIELAQIMKGLGCEYALNLDGGGSTAIVVAGQRLNSLESNMNGGTENRAVVSTVGFFRKR